MTNDDAIFAAAVDAVERRARAYMLNRTEVEALAEDVLVASRSAIEDRAEADLRERLAEAIEAEEPALFGSPEDPYQRGWSQMRGKAARIVRERP